MVPRGSSAALAAKILALGLENTGIQRDEGRQVSPHLLVPSLSPGAAVLGDTGLSPVAMGTMLSPCWHPERCRGVSSAQGDPAPAAIAQVGKLRHGHRA